MQGYNGTVEPQRPTAQHEMCFSLAEGGYWDESH